MDGTSETNCRLRPKPARHLDWQSGGSRLTPAVRFQVVQGAGSGVDRSHDETIYGQNYARLMISALELTAICSP